MTQGPLHRPPGTAVADRIVFGPVPRPGFGNFMTAFDLHRILLDDLPLTFLAEVVVRAVFAYIVVFVFLKVSGRRGIRQLSVFELVVILTLGSAAGDVTFYEDVPLLPVAVVFAALLALYRLTTYLMARYVRFANWLEGEPVTLIVNGLYEINSLDRLNVSEDEFFMELRQQGVEHLGQLRMAILEVDGDVSLYFFAAEEVRPGLSVLPPPHREVFTRVPRKECYACTRCGNTEEIEARQTQSCPRCTCDTWSTALHTVPVR